MNVLRFSDLCAQGQATGRRVFIRADLNVPQDDAGNITEDTRIRASVPCISLALEAGAAVMVTSHLGRPTEGEFKPEDSLAPVARRLARAAGAGSAAGARLGRRRRREAGRGRAAGELPRQQGREEEQPRARAEDGGALRHLRSRRLRHGPSRRSLHLRHRPVCQDCLRRPVAGRRDRRDQQGARQSQTAAGGHRGRLQGVDQAHHPANRWPATWTS